MVAQRQVKIGGNTLNFMFKVKKNETTETTEGDNFQELDAGMKKKHKIKKKNWSVDPRVYLIILIPLSLLTALTILNWVYFMGFE